MKRRAAAVLALGLGLGLAGCQNTDTSLGYSSNIPPPTNLDPMAAPPPGMAATAVRPGFDGQYTGDMYLERNPGGSCPGRVPIYGFSVVNNRVHFGQFARAEIAPDGNVQMAEGYMWIVGRFDGRRFVGNVTQGMPGCTYQMVLNRS